MRPLVKLSGVVPMVQAQFSLDESLWAFVQRSADYGFQNRDELIGLALGKLQQEFQALEASAQLYAEEYAEDADLRALTDSAIVGWVE
jgi:hypothetical protein